MEKKKINTIKTRKMIAELIYTSDDAEFNQREIKQTIE